MIEELTVQDDALLREIAEIAARELPNEINADNYYVSLRSEVLIGRAKALVTRNGERLTSVSVMTFGTTLDGEDFVSIDFMWIDPHYPKLFRVYLEYVDNLGVKRVLIPTIRNEEAFLRKYGKYGFRKKYAVFEKVM
jgi:hypothetical protein